MLWSHSFSYQSSLSLSSSSVVQCTLTKQTCFAHHSSFAHLLVRPQWTRLKWNHWPETRVLVSNKHIYKDFYKNVGQRLDLKNWRRESLHIRHVIVSENCQRKIWWPWSHQLWGSCKSAQQSWCVHMGKNFIEKVDSYEAARLHQEHILEWWQGFAFTNSEFEYKMPLIDPDPLIMIWHMSSSCSLY